ncbi:MAG: hypothetical protein VX278_00475 [Myxococcota bacterium]|nr:hypothetical protein [Myxococcota bacterium]
MEEQPKTSNRSTLWTWILKHRYFFVPMFIVLLLALVLLILIETLPKVAPLVYTIF